MKPLRVSQDHVARRHDVLWCFKFSPRKTRQQLNSNDRKSGLSAVDKFAVIRLPVNSFLGQSDSLSTPLAEISSQPTIRSDYLQWLDATDMASHVCFLDITYRRIDDDNDLHQVIIAPQGSAEAYSTLLQKFFRDGFAMAKHPVFNEGLPVYESEKGALETPETGEQLRACGENPDLKRADRVLLWVGSGDGLLQRKAVPFVEQDYYVDIKPADVNLDGATLAQLARTSIFEVWQTWVERVMAAADSLRSVAGARPGFLACAPVGMMADSSYKLLASVFLAVDGECDQNEAQALLRRICFQVLSTNASYFGTLLGRTEQRESEIASAQHEIKRVVDAISANSAPVILDAVRTYFLTLFGISGEFIDKMISEGKAPPSFKEALEKRTLQAFLNAALAQAAALDQVARWAVSRVPRDDATAHAGLDRYQSLVRQISEFEVPDSISWTRPCSLDRHVAKERGQIYWLSWNAVVAAYRNALRHMFPPQLQSLTVLPDSASLLRIFNTATYWIRKDAPRMESGTGAVLRNYVREAGCDRARVRIRELTSVEFKAECLRHPGLRHWWTTPASAPLHYDQQGLRESQASDYRTVWVTELPLPEFLFHRS